MWLMNACVIKKIPINNAAAVGSDPNVAGFIEKATQTLGKKGRFVIKLSGIPQENSVLAEGKSERLCNHCIEEFEKLLIRKGYMDHEHVWETLQETDYGEMDYNSYGGGVEHFVVTLYRCRLCGNSQGIECTGRINTSLFTHRGISPKYSYKRLTLSLHLYDLNTDAFCGNITYSIVDLITERSMLS